MTALVIPWPAMRGRRCGAATGGAQMLDGMFPVEMIEGVPVVVAPEEIDIANAEALRSALLKAAANGHGRLVVDMPQTRFCDSSGLHTLAAAHNRAQAEGREVLLVISQPSRPAGFHPHRHGPRGRDLHHTDRGLGANGRP
jgi:anti-anti-sigma factor